MPPGDFSSAGVFDTKREGVLMYVPGVTFIELVKSHQVDADGGGSIGLVLSECDSSSYPSLIEHSSHC